MRHLKISLALAQGYKTSSKDQTHCSTVMDMWESSHLDWIPWTVSIVIYKALCIDVAQGLMNGAPNETRTHLCRFASLAC